MTATSAAEATLMVSTIASTTTAVEAAATAATVSTTLMAVLVVALVWSAALVRATWRLLWVVAAVEVSLTATCSCDNSATSLLSHVVWNRVIDLTQLCVSISVLAIIIPLTVALVFKVATLLCLEPLIHLTSLKLLAGHASHLLLLRHLLLDVLLAWHWHLLLRLLLLLRVTANHLLIDVSTSGHWHLLHLRHRCFKLLLGLTSILLILLLRLLLLLRFLLLR